MPFLVKTLSHLTPQQCTGRANSMDKVMSTTHPVHDFFFKENISRNRILIEGSLFTLPIRFLTEEPYRGSIILVIFRYIYVSIFRNNKIESISMAVLGSIENIVRNQSGPALFFTLTFLEISIVTHYQSITFSFFKFLLSKETAVIVEELVQSDR